MKKATAAVIQKDGKLLIAKRKKDGFWEFPGGKIDSGETPEQCLLREILEELNMVIQIERLLGCIKGVYRSIPMEVYAFLATWKSGRGDLNVHADFKWVTKEEIQDYRLVEEDNQIVPLIKD